MNNNNDMTLKTDEAIEILRDLGFTDYEARIYITLLEKNPLNGNEISVMSGVPNSKVYENLRRLEESQHIFSVTEASKKKYVPLPFHDYLESVKKEFLKDTDHLEKFFEKISNKSDSDWSELYHIRGYKPSIEALKQEICDAEKEIFISCWMRELELLYDSLKKAHDRGVKVVSILFDHRPMEVEWTGFHHNEIHAAVDRHMGELSCVLDHKKVYIMESLTDDPHTVVGSHQVMVQTTRNYIRHDIYVNRIIKDFKEEMQEKYGENFEDLIFDI